ncbi:hypothetical protein PM027_17275 [[Clostridium] symbiosum]|uniref:hypothetical protein n=1 Tax=Clostridium symbiosum TaxID=1512 RepID=UPI001FAB6E22|nr:hypothetical protein [[Clostridium] symbiosum]MCQ4989420.1 hypothetical protein [[Clostridium] symbiosum]MDB2019806.1 hypothetical protein [[Clostridium] symbiosum]
MNIQDFEVEELPPEDEKDTSKSFTLDVQDNGGTLFIDELDARLHPLLVLRMKMAIKCAGRERVKDFDNLSLPPPLDSRKDRAMTPDCMIKTDWTKFRCSSYNEARYWFVFRKSTLCA